MNIRRASETCRFEQTKIKKNELVSKLKIEMNFSSLFPVFFIILQHLDNLKINFENCLFAARLKLTLITVQLTC